jgi:NADPH:quinone reductase
MMRAILLNQVAGNKQLEMAEIAVPIPKPDEVRIRVQAMGFNPSDIQMLEAASLESLPLILGGEVAGIVDEVGAGVTEFVPGDEVYAYLAAHRGGYAEFVCVHHALTANRPNALTPVQAAGIPIAALTAYQALLAPSRFGVQLQAGDSIFIAGGAGGVGTFALQMAQGARAGAIITTAGSDRSAHYLQTQLGLKPHQIVRYAGLSLPELREKVLEANGGKPIDIALDCVGGVMTSLCCEVIRFSGAVLSIVNGPTAAHSDDGDEEVLFNKAASFHFVLVYARAKVGDPGSWWAYRQEFDAISRLIEAGVIPFIPATEIGAFSLETVQQAHRQLASGHTQGKLVMRVY